MLKSFSLSLFLIFISQALLAQSKWTIEEMAPMPEPVTNNAVCEGFVNGFAGNIPYVFSFGGIDSTLVHTGIHNKSWRYNVETNIWESIADIPGTEKTIASSATYVNGKIYIFGGYTVAANGNEVSSDKVYIYNVQNNVFEANGASIPIAIDDHVQCLYKDSLIYIVTGWSNSGNVNSVQIYDTYNDTWQVGTNVPNTSEYRVFGSNGTIVGDTLYYYGGANTLSNFPATKSLKKGYINPLNPLSISWSLSNNTFINAYRMSCTTVNDTIFWIGGSEVSYNFDANAYDGSGIVSPLNQFYQYNTAGGYMSTFINYLPMDLRGIASISQTEKYLCGGIETNAKVSNKTLKLTWRKPIASNISTLESKKIKFQNPIENFSIKFTDKIERLTLMDLNGKIVFQKENINSNYIKLNPLNAGIYFLQINNTTIQKVLLKE